jgi:polyhydroxyalkanoate synthesis regulator phasin
VDVMSEENAPEQGMDDAEDRTGFLGRVREAWRDTVGAYATDDGETRNLFTRLVDFGHLTTDEAGKMLTDVRSRIETNRQELDARVDESIRRATARMTIPSPEELDRLESQVGELEARLARLENG